MVELSEGRKRRQIALWMATVVLGIAAVYGPHLENGFVYDDHPQIEQSKWVTGTGHWLQPFQQDVWEHTGIGSRERLGYYRPAFMFLNRGLYRLWGGDPFGFHLAGLIFHVFATLSVFHLVTVAGRTVVAAGVSSAIFAFHPAASETVFWAGCLSEQTWVIAGLSSLSLLIRSEAMTSLRLIAALVGANFLLAVALLSKETAIVLPVVATVWALSGLRKDGSTRSRLRRIIPLWALVAIFVILRSMVIQDSGLGLVTSDLPEAVGRSGSILLMDLRRLLFPVPMTLFLPGPPETLTGLQTLTGWCVWLLLGAVTVLVWVRGRSDSWWWALLILPLLPRLLPIFFGRDTGFLVADRYLLMSLAPWSLLVFDLGHRLVSKAVPRRWRPQVGVILLLLVLVIGGFASHGYGRTFQDDRTLFENALKVNPWSGIALTTLAGLSLQDGDVEQALTLAERAVKADPRRPEAHMNLGSANLRLGRPVQAAQSFQIALQLQPELPRANSLLGLALMESGSLDLAAKAWRRELSLDAGHLPSLNNLGTYHFGRGELSAAREYWESGLALSPDNPEFLFNLGLLYDRLGDRKTSVEALERFLEVSGQAYPRQEHLAQEVLDRPAESP